jgi:hypothetical protein
VIPLRFRRNVGIFVACLLLRLGLLAGHFSGLLELLVFRDIDDLLRRTTTMSRISEDDTFVGTLSRESGALTAKPTNIT